MKNPTKQEQRDEAHKAYLAINDPAEKAYQEIRKPAWKAYQEIENPAREAYRAKIEEINAQSDEVETVFITHDGREYKKGYTSGVIDNSINKDKLVLEARINVANKITVGGRGGTEIFIENVPLQTYLTQLKKGLSNE